MAASEKSDNRINQIVNFHRLGRPTAFTLPELLVVVGLLAVLLSILAPAVLQAGRHARAVVCQSQLRQWGLGFSLFVEEHGPAVLDTGSAIWQPFWPQYGDRRAGLYRCPLATRYELNRNDPSWPAQEATGCGQGSKFTAWKLPTRTPATLEPGPLLGSYGMNGFGLLPLDGRIVGGRRFDRSTIPIFLDCSFFCLAQTTSTDRPPAFDGELACPSDIKGWCIDRHDGGVNGLFLDWSVRKVGLKELWTLTWSPWFDRQGPWTHAGGVRPEDWPRWMRKFKDY